MRILGYWSAPASGTLIRFYMEEIEFQLQLFERGAYLVSPRVQFLRQVSYRFFSRKIEQIELETNWPLGMSTFT